MLSFISKHPENSILYPNNLQLSQWRWVFHHRLGVQNHSINPACKNPVPLTSDQLCWKTLMLTNSKTDDQCYTIINNISYTIINSRFLDPSYGPLIEGTFSQGCPRDRLSKLNSQRSENLASIRFRWSHGALWTGPLWDARCAMIFFFGDDNNSTTTVTRV